MNREDRRPASEDMPDDGLEQKGARNPEEKFSASLADAWQEPPGLFSDAEEDEEDADEEEEEDDGDSLEKPDRPGLLRELDEEEEEDDGDSLRYESTPGQYSQWDEDDDLRYENDVEQYTQMEYQYRMCKERMAYLLDELRRRIPPDPEQWEGWGYSVPRPEQPENSPPPPGDDAILPSFELLPRFWPRNVWEKQLRKPKWQETQGETKGENETERKFFYQKVGPDVDPAAGSPAEQLWHWILNVLTEEIQWVESRDRLQEFWKIRWADRYPETYAIVAKYAGWNE